MGRKAQQLAKPPFLMRWVWRFTRRSVLECWDAWFKNHSIKVVNELRLDLSAESGQAEYDRYMREFLGLEDDATTTEAS